MFNYFWNLIIGENVNANTDANTDVNTDANVNTNTNIVETVQWDTFDSTSDVNVTDVIIAPVVSVISTNDVATNTKIYYEKYKNIPNKKHKQCQHKKQS